MTTCAFCGRANDPGSQFCMDCGKPLDKPTPARAASGAGAAVLPTGSGTVAPARGGHGATAATEVMGAPGANKGQGTCPFCSGKTESALPFCPHCGRRLTAPGSGAACSRCASPVTPGTRFCATCGAPLGDTQPGLSRPSSGPERNVDFAFTLVMLDEQSNPIERLARKAVVTTIGREEGDLRFPDDAFMSPIHAKLAWETNRLVVRELGSRNGTWVFLEEPRRLVDGDVLLIGSQVFRFRRLGYPGPFAPEADATRRMGSLIPSADIASLTQLRSDGSPRDVIQLSPGRDVRIGRERGDWIFPYDPSMSAEHALVRSEDADFVLVDEQSRNGVALAARGDMTLRNGSKILVGDKLMRIEIP